VTRIQFRLPNGSTAFKQFASDDKFAVICQYATQVSFLWTSL